MPWITQRHINARARKEQGIRNQALSCAASLKGEIAGKVGQAPWVHAVVVFWAEFEATCVTSGRCTYVHGDHLASWLEGRPATLDPSAVTLLTGAIESMAVAAR